MSHSRLRNEANCLNCNTEVIGRFCHVCGQENIDPRESFWSLVTHFFNDITHFDGKFFKTVGDLVRKPGFLAAEYTKGRRARYLHPIRMYVFTSAVFFFIFYSYTKNVATPSNDSAVDVEIATGLAGTDTVRTTILGGSYRNLAHYDSVQNTLPSAQQDGWLNRMITKRAITINNRYGNNYENFIKDLLDGLIHSLPSLLFVALPFLAFLLKLLYSRHNFLYADHAIFLVFLFIFMFLLVLAYIGIDKIAAFSGIGSFRLLFLALGLYAFVYGLIAMKRFYGQGIAKTLVKYAVFNVGSFIVVIVLFIVFLLLTFFRV